MRIDFYKEESILESLGFVFIVSIVQQVVGFVKGIVFARLLGPTNYGVLVLAFFFISLVFPFVILGIPSCYVRYIPQYMKKGVIRDFFKKTYSLTILLAIGFSIIFALSSTKLSLVVYGSATQKKIIILCSLSIIPYVLFRNLQSSFAGLRLFKLRSLLEFIQICLYTMFGIGLVVFYSSKADSAIIGNFLGLLIVVFGFGFFFLRHLSKELSYQKIEENDFYAKILKYSMWFIFTPLIFTIFSYVDRWIINRLLSLSDVGIYSVGSNIARTLLLFGMMVSNVLMPNLSHNWENGQIQKVTFTLNLAIKIVTLFLMSLSLMVVLFKEDIIYILFGDKYISAVSIIPIFLIFSIFNSIGWILGLYPSLIEKPYFHFISYLSGLIINVLLNYLLIPMYGIRGAVTATTLAYTFILIFLGIIDQKKGLKIEKRTYFFCSLVLILLFNKTIMIFSYLLILFALIIRFTTIFSSEEKEVILLKAKTMLDHIPYLSKERLYVGL